MMDLSRDWPILGIEIDECLGFISGENWESGSRQILHFVQDFACGSYAGKSGSTC
jgi:hypothetical protein